MLRPFWIHQATPERSHDSLLWPLAVRNRHGARVSTWVLPLWYDSRHPNPDGSTDWDGFVLPFFFYGHDPEEGPYFLFFPLGGTWKGVFAQDRIDMALFPFYTRLRERGRSSTHILWPFYNSVTGPHHDGVRVWPLFGRYRGTTRAMPGGATPQLQKYERRFALWPFWHAQENDLETTRPTRVRWIFPFYGSIRSTHVQRRSILWPLYGSVHDERKQRSTHYSFLLGWNVTRSPDLRRTDFWPFYGILESPSLRRQFALFPIQRHETWKDGTRQGTRSWVLPFYASHRTEDLRSGTHEEFLRVWPLVLRHRDPSGAVYTYAPDLLPFASPERLELLYARFWRLYRAVDRGPERGHAWELLWGMVRRERTPQRSWFSLLGGLLGYEHSEGERRWKILYVPF